MSKSGQNNLRGVNFQAWVALSLFLQFLKKPEFSHIQLEGTDLEDFTLYFNDGTKIIGEAKVRKEKVQPSLLKDILKNIINRNTFISGDKILITCTGVSDELSGNLKYIEYYPSLQDKFRKNFKYPEEYIKLLSHVDFWVVNNDLSKESLQSMLADGIDAWLPQEALDQFTDSLVQKFMKLSESGSVYYRNDFLNEIQNLKNGIVSNASYYNPEFAAMEQQYDELEEVLRGSTAKDKRLAKSALAALSTNFGLMSFARGELEKKPIDNLGDWDVLWQMNRLRYFSYGIFETFKRNTHTQENRKYIISYCKQYAGEIRGYYQDDHFTHNVVQTLQKVLESASNQERKNYLREIFFIISELLNSKLDTAFYLKRSEYGGHDKWQKDELAKLLKQVYDLAEKPLKKEIVDLIWLEFDLTDDESELSRKVPLEVYAIVKDWLEASFKKNLPIFIKKINEQYHKSYGRFTKKGKKVYDGWQHIGGGTAFWGSNYHVSDKHFVTHILSEVFEKQYRDNPEKTWQFIKNECVAKENEVSESKPDFLNRSVYRIVLDRFKNAPEKESEEAFTILEEFLLQRKGIPHKTELIYQEVARSGNTLSSNKKVRLIDVTLNKYKIPVAPFVEEIIRDLSIAGDENAQRVLIAWFSNEKYYERSRIGESVGVASLSLFLDQNFNLGVRLFKSFISSSYFTEDKFELFDTYDVARTLGKITQIDPDTGIQILNELPKNHTWGRNQRALFCFGLFDHHEKNNFNKETLLRIYAEVVLPFLDSHNNDISLIVKNVPESGFREAIVKFAEYLAKDPNLLIGEALAILKVFLKDPDPYLPGEDPDPENEKYNEHKKIVETGDDNPSITSVRGWCGWTLMKCCVSEGRDHIDETTILIEELIKDKNYYALHMACFALAQLARVRLTYTDKSRKNLFLDNDPKKALKKAKRIENISFDLLKRIIEIPEENARKVLGSSVLKVFDAIRSLDQKDAKKFLKLIQKLPQDAQEDAAPFFLYYAFFRKDSYKDFKYKFPGLYDYIDSKEYDSVIFEKILKEQIISIQNNNPDGCFKIAANIQKILEDNKKDKALEKKTYDILELIALKYGHNVSGLIQRIGIAMLEKSNLGFKKWFNLLKVNLESELQFYKQQGLLVSKDKMPPTASQYYWHPSLWNREMLLKTLEVGDEGKFLELFEIILEFPLGFELNIDGLPLEKLKDSAMKGNSKAKKLLKKLYDFDPGKWRYLKELVR